MRKIVLRYHKSGSDALLGLMLRPFLRQSASVQEGQKRQPGSIPTPNLPRRVLIAIVAAGTLASSPTATAVETEARLAAAPEAEVGAEPHNAYFQATYVYQRHGSFRALYTGPNSLSPNHEKGYSFSATAYLGWRLGPNTELYFNPEVVEAVALSRLTGLGGLTNGENQKTAGPTPTVYRARLFVRQAWGFGGGKESVESSANQLSGEIDKRRLVVTAGNLAVIDLFDANPYSHDARSQFLNWAFMTHGAYDFAADARGYTWGAALEYYHDDWAIRAGRFLQPRESNGLQLDYRPMGHYGDQVELEHAHQYGGAPGKIRLLAFRNYARMGNFRDALDFAVINGGTPDVANVRKDQAKYGFGINADQQLNSDFGLLVRASWNDGATETYAFTEIERSATVGVKVIGSKWGRTGDSLFLGVIQNRLSAAHRDYVAAGGLGFFIGDGQINYRPEKIIEAMYVAKVTRATSAALGLQRIANPAYNADRGPVTVLGARLHLEY